VRELIASIFRVEGLLQNVGNHLRDGKVLQTTRSQSVSRIMFKINSTTDSKCMDVSHSTFIC
jgi:hypothetical protein